MSGEIRPYRFLPLLSIGVATLAAQEQGRVLLLSLQLTQTASASRQPTGRPAAKW
jgi:hypothetical protein